MSSIEDGMQTERMKIRSPRNALTNRHLNVDEILEIAGSGWEERRKF
jgi:hypothetical protein